MRTFGWIVAVIIGIVVLWMGVTAVAALFTGSSSVDNHVHVTTTTVSR